MPFTSFNIQIPIGNFAQTLRTSEGKFLKAATLMPEIRGTDNAQFYGEIWIAATDVPTPLPIALLASGYFGARTAISWTGSILLDPAYAVMARIYSYSTVPCRCTILTQDTP